MQPAVKTRMPRRIPKNPAVAMLVVGSPHCEVTTTKEATARRTPIPIVIRAGFHETLAGAGSGSIYVPPFQAARRRPEPPQLFFLFCALLSLRKGTNTSLAQQPREQSFQQNSRLRIHLSKFDTHPLTRHDVSDNRLRQNHASGYFKNEGQIHAYSQRNGPAEEQTSHA